MTKTTGATLFSGFGGVDIGMMAAGIDVIWGIEYDDKIAQVNRDNLGDHTITADILKCNPADFERPNLLHASPPCPNFSNAKTSAEESPNDKALADKVAEFIRVLLPDFFTLENVYQYRNSQSWQTIARTLLEHGYQFNYWHVNAADYGVPQTRKRMIVIARRDGIRPMLPAATHDKSPQNSFFENKKQWVGWYEAIEDLIPTLPNAKLTGRHKRTKHKDSDYPLLITNQNNRNDKTPQIVKSGPCCSLTAQSLLGWRYAIKGDARNVTSNCFQRIQSFPDWYKLPKSNSLATRGIGNAVPPLFYQRIAESLT